MKRDWFDVKCEKCGHQYTVCMIDAKTTKQLKEMVNEIRCPKCDPEAKYDGVKERAN